MYLKRYCQENIAEDLADKMVFVSGPRQVGKTTLAKQLLERDPEGLYLNWDNRADRMALRRAEWPAQRALVVLDEIHKYSKWKSWLKGEYDKHRSRLEFLVTGSARLEVYRKGGDSLQGRYHHHRLHPLSVAELEQGAAHVPPSPEERDISFPRLTKSLDETLRQLLESSCFPEPFLSSSVRARRRWRKERMDRFLLQDVRDLNAVRDIGMVQLLTDMLPLHVGSLLSVNSLARDLEVSHRAVSHWLDILEQLYFCFRVTPFESRLARSIRRAPKLYLWDHGAVPGDGARLENLVASHLSKHCHLLEDRDGHRVSLHFLRDKDGREVDFLIAHDRKPWIAVEVKTSSKAVGSSLKYYVERLQIPHAYQVVLEGGRDYLKDGIRRLPLARFLAGLA